MNDLRNVAGKEALEKIESELLELANKMESKLNTGSTIEEDFNSKLLLLTEGVKPVCLNFSLFRW